MLLTNAMPAFEGFSALVAWLSAAISKWVMKILPHGPRTGICTHGQFFAKISFIAALCAL